MRAILLVVACLFLFPTLSRADRLSPLNPNSSFQLVFGPCGNPCTVTHNDGGGVNTFKAAAQEVKHSNQQVIIAGECDSSCAYFADLVSSHVCITPQAKFGFHLFSRWSKPWITVAGDKLIAPPDVRLVYRYAPPSSRFVKDWIRPLGGFKKTITYMHYEYARRHWRTCK